MFPLLKRRMTEMERPMARMEPLALLRNEVDTLFDRFMEGWLLPEDFRPGWDMEEKDNAVVFRTEMAGFEPAEVEVAMEGNVVTVKAEHQAEAKNEAPRTFRKVRRSFTLPANVDPAKVEATYRNGVLEVMAPRMPGAAPRKLPVKT